MSKYSQICKTEEAGFSHSELMTLSQYLNKHFNDINNIVSKTHNQIQGEIYTKLRQEVIYKSPGHRLCTIFGGRIRHLELRMNPKERKQFVQLYNQQLINQLKQNKDTSESDIDTLRFVAVQAQQIAEQARLSANSADVCLQHLTKVEQMLAGD